MENVIVVGCQSPDCSDDRFASSMRELIALVKTAGGRVVGVLTQKRWRIDPSTCIGKGKLRELEAMETQLGAETVIFNDELTPGQQGRLNALVPAKILDRTQLILDIFAMRARSREGKLQVELAQLQYLLPRLSGMDDSLSRLGGGIGTRGPGETKLETNRRYIRNRMKEIRGRLIDTAAHRRQYRQRRLRQNQCQIALVGYTNAGKSTLFNQLTAAHTFAENRLFATLDPLTRKFRLPDGYLCLLTDTVGFIQDLPTELIAAFRSTLEEAAGARLLVHVVDVSDSDLIDHVQTVKSLLKEIGAGNIPVLTIYNKKDLLKTNFIVPTDALLISARDTADRERVVSAIEAQLIKQMIPYCCRIPAEDGALLYRIETDSVLKKRLFIKNDRSYQVQGFVFPETPLAAKLLNQDKSEDD
ncbi:MAG: GTPase HflX [Sporolactobacillus sp.]|jgi:GTP-binding protein HflX|nr:GTPase HflX [Sporolactobacillus sp.]